MTFDLGALKAYVGGLFSTGGATVSAFLIKAFETGTGIDIPATLEGLIVSGVAFVMGYVAVWITSNDLGKKA